ncbi:DNA-binding response regulator, NarL/FixJ family, contains REC and HTH domains [Arachidicoccus rhizosphaerae]|uniref:DNA-binding response regulator, NarL/FixJ family, contains REC and HTH domains n=1 Tax=Arachidicoccus rhizosphaerae TaxID=551991 RepID=A0A1H3Z480_9BACT|nr:response regulator transcription factor [Arachidicoccus rhizosphaerae]SEA18663.1 DNA-binding response regulator, NarL/FixJ family, contains REC and HTH domains [Arachidicoccus rhizosphaerae]
MVEKILVADDHGIVRYGLMMMIRKIRPDVLVEEAQDYSIVLEMAKKTPYDLYILDVSMPNGSFLNAYTLLKKYSPQCKILIFSSLDEEIYAMRYIESGADGFLNKLASEQEMQNALEKIFNNGKYVSDAVKDSLVFYKKSKSKGRQLDQLSNREIAIANMLVSGKSLKEISQELHLHVSTVSTYKTRIFEKLQIQSLPDLIKVLDLNN